MKTKEDAARMHARLYTGKDLLDIPETFPKINKECHSYLINEKERAFLAGIDFSNKWYSFKDHRPPYYKTCLVKVHEKTEPIAAWLASTGDSDIWTICSTDIILPPVKLWRPIF